MIPFPFLVSLGVLFLLENPSATSDQSSNYFLRSMASLTFLLGVIQYYTKQLRPIPAPLINYISTATLIASFTTLVLAISESPMDLTDLTKLSHEEFGWAIQSGLIYFAVAGFYKLISENFTSFHHQSLNVAVFALAIAFAGLCTKPQYNLPGTLPYNSFIYQTDCLYQFVLVPITFAMGTILLILGVISAADLRLPFVFPISKEGLTVLTLAVGLTTLLTGTVSMFSVALVNLAMAPGGFGEQ